MKCLTFNYKSLWKKVVTLTVLILKINFNENKNKIEVSLEKNGYTCMCFWLLTIDMELI